MCIRVEAAPRALLDDPWDPARLIITIPSELRDTFAVRAVRVVLAELDVPQPESGARCFCGEQIEVLPRVPEQRRSGQVMTHGA